jgi:ABC-2 type transport system ATP-binding protein
MLTTPAISVEGLTKDFGPVRAVDDLSFDVPSGAIVGVLGPNGSGKTTTLRMLLGLVAPDGGRALVEGRPYAELDAPASRVGAVLDARAFHPGRTARNHLRAVAIETGAPRRRVDEVLDLVGLTGAADRRAGGFSLGMGQRLTLAAALIADPRILILDEPANGLDPEGIRWLRGFLRGLADEGRTVLVSSHSLAEVEQTVDDVVIIAGGRLVAQGPIATLAAEASSRVLVRTPQTADLAAVLVPAGGSVDRTADDELAVEGLSADAIGRLALEHHIVLHAMNVEEARLEDVFFSLTTPEEALR